MSVLILQTLDCEACSWWTDLFDTTSTPELLKKQWILQGKFIHFSASLI